MGGIGFEVEWFQRVEERLVARENHPIGGIDELIGIADAVDFHAVEPGFVGGGADDARQIEVAIRNVHDQRAVRAVDIGSGQTRQISVVRLGG